MRSNWLQRQNNTSMWLDHLPVSQTPDLASDYRDTCCWLTSLFMQPLSSFFA